MHLSSRIGLIALLLAGCTDTSTTSSVPSTPFVVVDAGAARADYRVTFSGFPPQADGAQLRAKVQQLGNVQRQSAALSQGSATILFPAAVDPRAEVTVDAFLDLNGDGACQPCGTSGEPAWRLTQPGGAAVSKSYDTNFFDISPY